MNSATAVFGLPKPVEKDVVAQPAQENHIVQFYEDEEFLCDVVARFLGAGLEAGEPLAVIATEAHWKAFSQRLTSNGFDVESACRAGRITALDARETLSRIMVGGIPDWGLFKSVVGPVLQKSSGASKARVRAYGEMVDLLWQDGNPQAAIRLEELWNDIGKLHSFALLCAYLMGNFRDEAHAQPFHEVCSRHSHVIPTENYSNIEDPDARLREVTLLQQRARALETEIEHRREVEKALREALRTRDDFLSIAGHELKTPLTALQLQVQSLLAITPEAGDPRVRERLGKAARHIDRLSNLIEGLLDVSRISAGRFELAEEEVDLGELVREVVDRLGDVAARSGCHVRVLAQEPVTGHWDRMRIEQVAINLLSNAIKYGRGRPIEVSVQRSGNRARIVVRDQGIGISVEDQPRIFDRFERAVSSRHFGGLGLGLWIARQVVEAHGGTIRVESESGRGATFTVELPYLAST